MVAPWHLHCRHCATQAGPKDWCSFESRPGGDGKGTFCQAPDLRLFSTSSCAWYAASFSCFFHSRSSLLPPLQPANNYFLAGLLQLCDGAQRCLSLRCVQL